MSAIPTSFPTDRLAAPAAPLPRELFGYEVIDRLGTGAGSTIYAVTDRASGQVYAAKHVVRTAEKDIRFVEQLENEYAVGKQVSHPGLRRAVDLKVNRTLLRKVTDAVLVLELFDGQPLDRQLAGSVRGIVKQFVAVAHALEALHGQGFVHCDLKPINILISPTCGAVKVIDFGQACPVGTAKKRIQGTPDYIAPEQVRLQPVTARTDVFNFGATLYWALTGRKLPTLITLAKGDNSLLSDALLATPAQLNPQVPEVLSNLVMECVRTNPAKRPAEMAEVTRRLELLRIALKRAARQPVAVSA